MGNQLINCYFKEKKEQYLVKTELKQEMRTVWNRAGYTDKEIQKILKEEYLKKSKHY